jgi:hypothetical protein
MKLLFVPTRNRGTRASWLARRRENFPPAFVALAREYRRADAEPDDPPGPVERPRWDSRVRKKDVIAEGLGRFAQKARLDRKALAAVDDDGYIVALMKLIAAPSTLRRSIEGPPGRSLCLFDAGRRSSLSSQASVFRLRAMLRTGTTSATGSPTVVRR